MPAPNPANPRDPWQRLLDAIGPGYSKRLFEARDRAKAELSEVDEEELTRLAAEGRKAASSLDEEGARLTIRLHADRDRYSQLAHELEREAHQIARQAQRALSRRRRREGRADAAERSGQAESYQRLAAEAHQQIRELGQSGRHLYPWFERHQNVLALALAAEGELNRAHGAAYHVLGAPGIATLTAVCLRPDRAIDLERLEELVNDSDDRRARLVLNVAAQLYGGEQHVVFSELLAELDGEDLDRVLEAIAVLKRRKLGNQASPADLWIRAAQPDVDQPESGS